MRFGKTEKPQPAFYVGIVTSVLRENPLGLSTPFDLQMDCAVVEQRTQAEGVSFLTKTLPRLGKAVLHRIEHGAFPPDFREFRMSGGMPLFLGGYLNALFCEEASEPSEAQRELAARALAHIQQVTMVLYKLQLGFDEEAERAFLDGFKAVEKDLLELTVGEEDLLHGASYIVRDIFEGFDPKNILPRHGPGAVATGERLWDKWSFKRLYNQIHQYYPYFDYFMCNGTTAVLDSIHWYKGLERLETGIAKFVLVEKDSRGPRGISMEPLEYQYVQQGLSREVVFRLEHHPLTKGHVNFSDQMVNRSLALESSRTKEYCTMDLKDASDRVSLQLVEKLFRHSPELLRALKATRTSATELPNGEIVEMKKFAPMGSALCFPVEATCFFALCVAAIARRARMRQVEAAQLVYVYGDDIIVPVEYMNVCADTLERFGLRVNRSKSFANSHFRESCGMDAFYGVQVTPTRVKKLLAQEPTGTSYAAYVQTINAFRKSGYWIAASWVQQFVEKLYGQIPHGVANTSFPCIIEESARSAEYANRCKGFKMRWNRELFHVEFKVRVLLSPCQESRLEGWARVLQNLLQPVRDGWTARRSTKLQRRWRSLNA